MNAVHSRPAAPWIVAVGASGDDGLRDIKALLRALGPDPDAVVMVVLHRLFDRPSHLRAVLQAGTDMAVIVAGSPEKLRPGCCYIGEPASHLTLLAASYGDVVADAARQHRNRTVDLLFKSVARHAGPRAIGVVLSGALDDGSRGIEAIHHAGGLTMVLLRSVAHAGMPENAIAYDGPIDCIGSRDRIAEAITAAITPSRPAATLA
ncbi:chemotaxis protein CheB [Lichenibacterium ramalinae]|uniref:protein-glutamate methylesterase n=1 Tax=Lichenibacterium ramalinae TaxID=2316527 RepID=A0A4Q2R978_9HYPH|nr:chemotaxis protein CheB [Lichenibacterium ramalinae]RYB03335.1 chemotaxis protein CheB [Lichenibacterium ramalinae]